MPRNYKRILSPLFFVIIALVVLCCSVFADDVSGIPRISINGGPETPFISSVVFEDGDNIIVLSSGICPFVVNIPSGVTFTVNPNVTIQTNRIEVRGILNNYGTIYRSGTTTGNASLVGVTGITNIYYGSVIEDCFGNAIKATSSSIFNIYNGNIIGADYGVEFSEFVGAFNYYGGSITGGISPFTDSSFVNVYNGNLVIDNDTGTATVKNNLYSVVTDLISESLNWIRSFVSAITSNNVLLVFVLVMFTGLGIGLLRRVKSI